jgi:hypothetical protein
LLNRVGQPSQQYHVNTMGPGEWMKPSAELMNENLILRQAFKSVAQLLLKLEGSAGDWHLVPIWGTPMSKGSSCSTMLKSPCSRHSNKYNFPNIWH